MEQRQEDRTVLRASLATGAGAALAAALGTGKEMLVSRAFGVSAGLDAYLLAATVVTFGAGILAGSLQTSLIPVLAAAGSPRRRLASAQATLTLALLAGGCCWLLSLRLLPWFLRWLDPAMDPAFAAAMSAVVSPLWCTGTLSGTVHGLLQAERRFLGSGLIPVCIPLVIALALLASGLGDDVFVLAWGTVAGAAAEVLAGLALLWRRGFPARPGLAWPRPEMSRLWRQTTALLPGMTAMASAGLVDRAMAATLGPGAVAIFNYGGKLPSILASLGGMAVATALLPRFSERLGAGDFEGGYRLMRRWTRWMLWWSLPVTVALALLSPWVTRLVFEGGQFTGLDTALVAEVQTLALAQIPLFWSSLVASRFLAAAGRNHWLSALAGVNVLVNVAGNWLLMGWLGPGGIALATALMYGVSAMICLRGCTLEQTRRRRATAAGTAAA